MSTPSDGSNSSGLELSDDGSYGFTRHRIARPKCRVCPEINSISRTALRGKKCSVCSKNSETWNKRPRRNVVASFMNFRERQRKHQNNSVHFIATRNAIRLMMANKSCQTTESSSSSCSSLEKDTTPGLEDPVCWVEQSRRCETVGTNLLVPSADPIASSRSLPSEDQNRSDDPTKKPVPTKPINAPKIPETFSSEKIIKNGRFLFRAKSRGLSMSDSVLAVPKYSGPNRSLTVLRQRRLRQGSCERPAGEREESILRCRRLTSSHRIKSLGNEVHQILTRNRSSAKKTLVPIVSAPDRKRKHSDDEASVKFLWKSQNSRMTIPEFPLLPMRSMDEEKNPPKDSQDSLPSSLDRLSSCGSQSSVQIIEIRECKSTDCSSDKDIVGTNTTTENHVPSSKFNFPTTEKILILKKEPTSANDWEHDPWSSAADETAPRNFRAMDDNDDYHFLMSLHNQLRRMPRSKKLKMRLRIQTMFCEDIETASRESFRSPGLF